MISRLILAALLAGVQSAHAYGAGPTGSLRVQVVDEAGKPVSDAVVEVTPAGAANLPVAKGSGRLAMAQKNLQFVPGTMIVPKGSTVAFPNLDTVRHSVYSFSDTARFTIELYGRDQSRTQQFAKSGSVKLGCNIHDQMRGYIRVTEAPFATKTDATGFANLAAVPTGAARVTVWHPALRAPANELKQQLTIAAGPATRQIKVRMR